ncbi:MAG: glycosyltransferase family 4 protein [Thermoguttaceae bacterium]
MRLLFLCEYGSVSGGENSLRAVLPTLRQRGFEVVVAAPPESELSLTLQHDGVETLPLPYPAGAISLALKRELLETFLRRVASETTIVHSNSLAMGRVAGVVAKSLGLAAVTHIRDIVRLSSAVVRDLNTHDAIIAVSDAVRRFHIAQGLHADKTRVIYNGIDVAQWSERSPTRFLHRELGLADDAILVATVGQISLRKGVAAIPDIWDSVVAREPSLQSRLHWLIVGERWSGKEESVALETTLRRDAATRPIHFLGHRNDVAVILPELTLLVHTAHEEPFGRVLLESALSGVAVVARDVGGTREIFGETLPPIVTDSEIAAEMCLLLTDTSHRDNQRHAAQERVAQLFTVERSAEGLIAIYDFIVARK